MENGGGWGKDIDIVGMVCLLSNMTAETVLSSAGYERINL